MKFNKQKVMKVLPFIILGYFFNKVSQAFTSAAGTELGDKIMNGMDGLGAVFINPLPSFNPIDLLIGVAGGVIVKLVIYVKGKNAKKYRKGCEYGSARWGNAEDIKYVFKACVAVFLLSHTFEITIAIFDVGQWVVNQAATSITNDTYVDVLSMYNNFRDTLDGMDCGELIVLIMEAAVVSLAVKAIAILVLVVLTNRMIEIYLYCSVAPIPFATMTNREWGNIGTNYIRSMVALAFQGFFIMVIVGIYSVLVKDLSTATDLHDVVMKIGAYSVILCLSLFKTSSISKSIFNAH